MTEEQAEHLSAEQPAFSTHRLNFFQGVAFTGTGIAVNIVFLFVETAVAARLLDTDAFGIYALLIVVVHFLVMVIDFGCKTAIIQLVAGSDPVGKAALSNSVVLFRLLVVALVSVFIWLGRYALNLIDPSHSLVRYAVYIPIMLLTTSLDELLLAILQGYQAYKYMAIAEIIRSVLRLGLSVVFLVVLNLGVKALIYSWIISFGVAIAYEYAMLPLSRQLFLDRHLMGKVLRFGLPLQVDRFLWFISGHIDVLLLGALIGPTAVAIFNIAGKIPTALLRLTQSYTAVYFPTVTALLASDKKDRACWLLDHSLRLTSFVTALGALISVVFGQLIVSLLFSEKYAASGLVFGLLMMALHMTVLLSLLGYTLTAAGYPGRSLGVNVVRETLAVLANLILIPIFGIAGAPYAKLTAYYIANPISVWLLRRSDIRASVIPYIKQTVLLWLCVIVFWGVQPESHLVKVTIIIAFLALNIAFSTISQDDLQLILPKSMLKRWNTRGGAI